RLVMPGTPHGRLANINTGLLQLFLQLLAKLVVVHLTGVAGTLVEPEVGNFNFVADSRFDIRRPPVTSRHFGTGQLGPVIRQRPDTADRLKQANEVQIVVSGVHHPAVQGNPVHIPEIDKGLIKERKADPESGAGTDDIEGLTTAVDKLHFIPMQRLDGRARMYPAM